MMKIDKFEKILISKKKYYIGGFIVLLLSSFGLSYSFFTSQTDTSKNTNVKIANKTVDKLTFSVGDNISISATSSNFKTGASNISGSTTASANIIASNTAESITNTYNLYLEILTNNFVYSDGSTPEILLTIVDPSGNPVTSLTGYTYLTSHGVSGFDVTTASGLINIAKDYSITTSDYTTGTTQTWNVTLTLLALDTDQSPNANKSLNAKLIAEHDYYVPSNYTQLTYLESSGTQYIDTGYILTSGKEKTYLDFMKTNTDTFTSLFGSNSPASNTVYTITPHGTTSLNIYCGDNTNGALPITVNTEYLLSIEATNLSVTTNITDKTNNSTTVTNTYSYTINNGDLSTVSNSIYLFGTHSPSGGAQTSSERIYEFKLWDNDVLVRDMVPVLNGSSVPGMYDKITGTFYQNLGNGDFTYIS
jgi:hypothetical protein